jgi:hypothetical protein
VDRCRSRVGGEWDTEVCYCVCMYVFCVGKVSKYEVCRSCGGKLPLSVISRSSKDGYVHRGKDGWENRDTVGRKEKFRVGRAETLWDERRNFRVGRPKTLWDEMTILELGEQRHCGTKGGV